MWTTCPRLLRSFAPSDIWSFISISTPVIQLHFPVLQFPSALSTPAFSDHDVYSFVFSPHSFAMPKGLYFTTVVFSFFFFLLFSTPNLWGHWTDLNQTGTHIHLWLLFEKFGPNSPGHLPATAGAGAKKTLLWDRLSTLSEHIFATEHDINNQKKKDQLTGTPLHVPQIWWTSARKQLRTVGEFLPTP